MVDKETVTGVNEITLPVQKMERNADGSWSLVLDVENLCIPIDATRTAQFFGELRIKGRQRGRKVRDVAGFARK